MLKNDPLRDPYLDLALNSSANAGDVGWIGVVSQSEFDAIAGKQDISIPAAYKNDAANGEIIAFSAQTSMTSLGAAMSTGSPGWSELVRSAETSMASPLGDKSHLQLQPQCSDPVILGVIDFGCAYLHPEFRVAKGSNKTRIISIWDQGGGSLVGGWVGSSELFGYGRMLLAKEIDQRISRFNGGGRSEFEYYEGAKDGYLINVDTGMSYGSTHGTHVLSVAAGLTDPRVEFRESSEDWAMEQLSAKNVAPALVFVHLPLEAYRSSDRGSLGKFIVDGVRFILSHRKNGDQKVVINISYGPYAGPHNGYSVLERCLDHLISNNTNLEIVLGAGNGRLSRTAARTKLAAGTIEGKLDLCIPAGDRTATYVEVWTNDSTVTTKVLPANDLTSRCQTIRSARQVGDRYLTLVAFPPPSDKSSDWHCQLVLSRKAAKADCDVHAWIEKDSSPDGEDYQSYFTGPSVALDASSVDTRSSFATGYKTTVIGACSVAGNSPSDTGAWSPGQAKPVALGYSGRSAGAANPKGFAIAEIDPLQPGLWGATVLHDKYFRMGGTSVAAPLYCRYLVEKLRVESPPAAAS